MEKEKGFLTLLIYVLGEQLHINVEDFLQRCTNESYVEGYTSTQIGELLEVKQSAIQINKLLEKNGYQTKDDKKWRPTKIGEKFALKSYYAHEKDKVILIDFNIKWRYEIIEVLENAIKNESLKEVC